MAPQDDGWPYEYHRVELGPYFVTRCGYWWYVCEDRWEDWEVVAGGFALLSTAIRYARGLHVLEEEDRVLPLP